ncbi:EAL and HDOD domain-containing protein [Nitrincola tibetensis]|nr:HDOD domain-containing protein [Nitrincola tibetensis]
MSEYCVALQPICDSSMKHVADELLYRSSSDATSAFIDDPIMATARVCNAAFYETGIEALVGKRLVFFNAPRDWLLKAELLPPCNQQVVIEILEDVEGDKEIIAALTKLRDQGFTIALDDFVLTEETQPLLDLAHIIKLDVLSSVPSANQLEEYKRRGLVLLAEKVEDLDTFMQCVELGFTLFQGYFYAKPEVKAATVRRRANNRAAQLRLLAALQQPEPDFDALEHLIAQDAQLCLRILRLSNSAFYRRQMEISSIRQALLMLGFKQVRNLVTTLMLADNHPCNTLILPRALIRASMCEKIATSALKEGASTAFMVGILSMMDLLLDESLESLCEQLALTEEVKVAILYRQGQLGKILKLTIAYETAQLNGVNQKTVKQLNRYYFSSCEWANTVLDAVV